MSDSSPTVGVYPGSFDPLTVAHLAVAEAAVVHLGLVRVDLAISTDALGKAHLGGDTVGRRVELLERAIAHLHHAAAIGAVIDLDAETKCVAKARLQRLRVGVLGRPSGAAALTRIRLAVLARQLLVMPPVYAQLHDGVG